MKHVAANVLQTIAFIYSQWSLRLNTFLLFLQTKFSRKYIYCTTNSMATEYGLTAWRARNVVMYDIQFLGAWCVCETYARLTAFKQHQVRR